MSAGLEPKRSYLEMMGFAEEKAKVPKVTSGMKEPVVGSKNFLKAKRKDEQWEANVQKRKEKRKAKRQKDKEARNAAKAAGHEVESRKRFRKGSTVNPVVTNQRVCIDLDFDAHHQLKDVKKIIKQVQTSYSVNRRCAKPFQYHLTSLEGRALERYTFQNGLNWEINTHPEPYEKVFAKEDIVYLSSESENTLEKLDESKVYIIGGLVDHNNCKGLCHKLAVEKGMAHARLPIDDFVKLDSRRVLTVNHVFEILCRYHESEDWRKAFFDVIPERKFNENKEKGQKLVTKAELIAAAAAEAADYSPTGAQYGPAARLAGTAGAAQGSGGGASA